MHEPLRIGVLLDSLEVDAWKHRVLQDIYESDFCEIVLAVINDRPVKRLGRFEKFRQKLREFWDRGLYKLYVRWDRRRYGDGNNANSKLDVSALLDKATRLRVVPIEKKYTDRFSRTDIEAIERAGLDVMIRFGFRIIKGEILDCARYGVWSYHHGDNREYRGGPAMFWEMYERNPVTGTILQILSSDLDAGHVIYRSWSSTRFDSFYKNRNAVFWKSSAFVIRRLRDLYTQGWDCVADCETQENIYKKRIYRAPSNLQMVPFLVRIAGLQIKGKFNRSVLGVYNHWRLVVRPAGAWRRKADGTEIKSELVPPKDRFYADGFLYTHESRNYVFFEEYSYSEEKGVISFCEINSDLSFTKPEVVLEKDYHLSYPFVFEVDGDIFMIPETKENSRIELYRSTRFPREWEFEGIILADVPAVDATIYNDGKKLWLFCNIEVADALPSDELHVFMGDRLLGDWVPHPSNPVISDVRRARPAGRLFVYGDALIRPSQDCSVRYGYGIGFNRVTKLSERDYKEEMIDAITAANFPGSLGTHTVDQNDKLELLDVKYPIRKFQLWNERSRQMAQARQ